MHGSDLGAINEKLYEYLSGWMGGPPLYQLRHGTMCMGEESCPACGRYRIADALVLAMIEEGQIFDVSKTRIWLTIKRKQEAIPAIEIHEALLVP